MKRMVPLLALSLTSTLAFAEDFHVDPSVGNSTFTAVFDAKIGERISATSSAVACDATYDEKSGTFSGSCQVPLTTIKVDNEDTKTEHFQQWSTNKKSEAKDCKFEARFTGVKVGQLAPETPAKFSAEVLFTICGRSRSDGGKEQVHGKAMLLPAGSYGTAKTIRVRATIDRFDRDKYHIGPKYTDGWLARVQSLAKVVAEEGTIDLTLFAKTKNAVSEK
jgi:hypothetical protein